MQFKCNKCSTGYRVDDSKIPKQNFKVKCKKCQNLITVRCSPTESVKKKKSIICPKCNHGQKDSQECEACGVIFSKIANKKPTSKSISEQSLLEQPAPEHHQPSNNIYRIMTDKKTAKITALIIGCILFLVFCAWIQNYFYEQSDEYKQRQEYWALREERETRQSFCRTLKLVFDKQGGTFGFACYKEGYTYSRYCGSKFQQQYTSDGDRISSGHGLPLVKIVKFDDKYYYTSTSDSCEIEKYEHVDVSTFNNIIDKMKQLNKANDKRMYDLYKELNP